LLIGVILMAVLVIHRPFSFQFLLPVAATIMLSLVPLSLRLVIGC